MQALQAHFGVDDNDLWQVATALGAGIGRRGLVCGAVTGACIAVGVITARTRGTEDVAGLKEESYAKVLELTRRFEEQFGTTSCRTMTGCDLLSVQGREDFQKYQMSDLICRPALKCVVTAVADICH